MDISLLLTIIAIVCFVLAAVGASVPRVQLGWLGLALWALASVV